MHMFHLNIHTMFKIIFTLLALSMLVAITTTVHARPKKKHRDYECKHIGKQKVKPYKAPKSREGRYGVAFF